MSKSQFLQLLSEKLSEELPRSVVLSNLEYYESYIDGEVAKGRSLDAVMEELGDPYMIARTIIDTQTGEAFENQNYAEETVYTETTEQDSVHTAGKRVVQKNYGCLISTIIIILICVIVLSVVGSVISFLWPILAPILLIMLIVSIVKGKQR